MKAEIKIKVLNIDEGDDTIHFQGFFRNELCSTTLDFYGYSDEFQEFANKLSEFPKTTKDKVTYQIGEKGQKWAYYLLIQAYCIEPIGRTSLKIEVANNGTGLSHHESKFEIESEPASLNRFGNKLKTWNPLEEMVFVWKAYE